MLEGAWNTLAGEQTSRGRAHAIMEADEIARIAVTVEGLLLRLVRFSRLVFQSVFLHLCVFSSCAELVTAATVHVDTFRLPHNTRFLKDDT